MIFRLDQLLLSLSIGLDEVEKELLGVSTNHGKRIAILSARMGRHLGFDDDQLVGVAFCALLHDNALSEYRLAIEPGETQRLNLKLHCIRGEENGSFLPFPCDVRGYILYHHEFVDKSGPLHVDANDIPLGAQLIGIANDLDVHLNLRAASVDRIDEISAHIRAKSGNYYTKKAADAMLGILDADLLHSLADERVDRCLRDMLPRWIVDQPAVQAMKGAEIIARITDYKSKFTAKHSTQIANRAHLMARHYGFDENTCARIYIAAALHDIGKLMTPTEILEKPGKLTDSEFEIIKEHVYWSYIMLKDVRGMEEICRWAVSHHRKLDGSGYPDLPAIYLTHDFVCRLMTCIDIYQAVRETRPYHGGRTHEQTMKILWEMVDDGKIDRTITEDLDRVMAQFPSGDGDIPHPFHEEAASV